MVREPTLGLIVLALAACSDRSDQTQAPAAFASTQAAVQQICMSRASHREIVAAVRALTWPLLGRGAIPQQVVGNGAITWSQVAVSPDHAILVAAGRLGGTSFCRVYGRRAELLPIEADLERTVVLGAPLGAPTYRRQVDGADVASWLKQADGDWRAIHLSVLGPSAGLDNTMGLVIEVTQPEA